MPLNYLDVDDLPEVLGLSVAMMRKKLRARPWTLPPRANAFGELLRWRRDEVEYWVLEVGWTTCGFAGGWQEISSQKIPYRRQHVWDAG